MGKIAAAKTAIKNTRMPTPGEIKDGYLNSTFHKSLHQPLIVKSKVEKTDVQKARQAMTQVKMLLFHMMKIGIHFFINQEKTPLQLGNIESLTDIPIPSVRKSKQNQEVENGETSEMTMHKSIDELGKTILPASFFEQNIVTAVKENLDPEQLEKNRTLTKTKTPAQLAAINSISDIPVPDKIKSLLSSGGSEKKAPESTKKRR